MRRRRNKMKDLLKMQRKLSIWVWCATKGPQAEAILLILVSVVLLGVASMLLVIVCNVTRPGEAQSVCSTSSRYPYSTKLSPQTTSRPLKVYGPLEHRPRPSVCPSPFVLDSCLLCCGFPQPMHFTTCPYVLQLLVKLREKIWSMPNTETRDCECLHRLSFGKPVNMCFLYVNQ